MKFDPKIHQRRSIRLPDYDYSQAGAYFVTMVTFRRECLFGEIRDGKMRLSGLGLIADENWHAIPEHFPGVELGAFVVMPNHAHGIITIVGATQPVGATMGELATMGVGATHWVAPTSVASTRVASTRKPTGPKRRSIGAIIGAYKMAVTRRIQKELNSGNIWQRNYYEHIIRDDDDYKRIHSYIESNIDNWTTDDENPVNPK